MRHRLFTAKDLKESHNYINSEDKLCNVHNQIYGVNQSHELRQNGAKRA